MMSNLHQETLLTHDEMVTKMNIELTKDNSESSLDKLATASRTQEFHSLANRLIDMRTQMAEDLKALESRLASVTTDQREDSVAWLCAEHLLNRPGKRVRPLCVLLATKMGGQEVNERRDGF